MAKRLHAEEKADFRCHEGSFSFYKYWPISHSAEHVCSVGCISPQQITQEVSQGFQIFLLEIANQQIFTPSSFLVSGTSFWSDKLQGDIWDCVINSGKKLQQLWVG